MLSLSSLLNPISTSDPRQTDSAPTPSYYSDLLVQRSARSAPRIALQEFSPKSKMSKDGAVFSKGKIKGRVVYPPFEKLDQNSLRAVRKFKVYPFGDIAKYPRHIPYNSEKKSFLEKTGRESFEGEKVRLASSAYLTPMQYFSTPFKFQTTTRTTQSCGTTMSVSSASLHSSSAVNTPR